MTATAARSAPRSARRQEGQGLVEALVALAVLLILSAAVAQSLVSASASTGTSRAQTTAANLAAGEQAQLRSLDSAGLDGLAARPAVQRTVGKVAFTIRSTPWTGAGQNDMCKTGAGPSATVCVRTTVSWTTAGKLHEFRLSTLVSRPD